MSVEERARLILYDQPLGTTMSQAFQVCVEQIQQAMDSARAEGYQKGKTERHQQCPFEEGYAQGQTDKLFDWLPELKKAHAQGFSAGAAAMRKVASEVADSHALIKGAHVHKGFSYCVRVVADQIRALPLSEAVPKKDWIEGSAYDAWKTQEPPSEAEGETK